MPKRLRHGETRRILGRLRPSAEYAAWANMKARCYCPTNPFYYNYGARGIRVCARLITTVTIHRRIVSGLHVKNRRTTSDRVAIAAMTAVVRAVRL
jgi:hypothetical protein